MIQEDSNFHYGVTIEVVIETTNGHINNNHIFMMDDFFRGCVESKLLLDKAGERGCLLIKM